MIMKDLTPLPHYRARENIQRGAVISCDFWVPADGMERRWDGLGTSDGITDAAVRSVLSIVFCLAERGAVDGYA